MLSNADQKMLNAGRIDDMISIDENNYITIYECPNYETTTIMTALPDILDEIKYEIISYLPSRIFVVYYYNYDEIILRVQHKSNIWLYVEIMRGFIGARVEINNFKYVAKIIRSSDNTAKIYIDHNQIISIIDMIKKTKIDYEYRFDVPSYRARLMYSEEYWNDIFQAYRVNKIEDHFHRLIISLFH